MNPALLLREDLRGFSGYRSARSELAAGGCETMPCETTAWLNANEASRANVADAVGSARRYPEPQPTHLREALANLYGCGPEQLLLGRGSDEAIDLLVRAFCTPARDAVLVTPPVFGMYAVCARLQGARLLDVPLVEAGGDFHADLDAVAMQAIEGGARLVFLCSPGNPAGTTLGADVVIALAQRLSGQALVVVDEAYVEYADTASLVAHVASQPNLAVLRTLSKAHALAGARLGCLVADARVIAALRCCQAPYPVPAPVLQLALRGLSPDALQATARHVVEARVERTRMRTALGVLPGVTRVYPSQANFLLVRFSDPERALQTLQAAGIVVRDMRAMPQLSDALRITLSTPDQNDAVLATLASLVGEVV